HEIRRLAESHGGAGLGERTRLSRLVASGAISGEDPMTKKLLLFVLFAIFTAGRATAQEAKVTELMSKDLKGMPAKEATMIMVESPPGSSDPVHRHNAQAFVYVLEGSIVMQLKGSKEVTLTAGQTFYEGPDDVHVVGRNASKTKPAKFIV